MKRILLLDHPQFTSATYYLWQGLKELEALFGEHLSVSCYPYIPTNYDELEFNLLEMPWFRWLDDIVEKSKAGGLVPQGLPFGIPAFQKDEHLTSRGDTIMRRGAPWRTFGKDSVIPDEGTAIMLLEKGAFDLIILGNSHRVPTILLGRLKEKVPVLPPIVYLDAGERDELNEHWIHVFQPVLVFKQILTPEVKARGLSVQIPGYELKMYPLPLSSPLVDQENISIEGLSLQWLRRNSKISPKMMPVFYWMGNTWPEREKILRALDHLVSKRDLARIKGCGYLNYNLVMAKSRMGVTMRGSGRDTTRYWEIPFYKTLMISDGTMGCIHPYPFEDGKTALFYRSIEDLIRIVDEHLTEEGAPAAEVHRIALNGMEHLERYHSTAARAMFFLDILHKELGFCDKGLLWALGEMRSRKQWDERSWEGPVV